MRGRLDARRTLKSLVADLRMNKKWIIYIVLIVVAFVLIVVFSKNIYFWLSNQLWKILLLAAVFGGGWLLGRFGGKKNGTQQGNGN